MSEHLLTREELEASKGATGRIVRIVGPVVDVEFPPESMPGIYNALTVDAKTLAGDMHVVLEVETHLPGNLVRSVAMSSTDGLVRGLEVLDTGHPIMMPVGNETLGRIWNVMGEPVDEKPMPDVTGYMPIHRPAPEYDQLSTKTEIFETGIKAIDLIEPFIKGGKTGLFGGAGVGKTVIIQELLQNYKDLQDIIAILGMDELSEEQKLIVNRARKAQQFFGQCFHVAKQFTGLDGKYVKLEDTIRSFGDILDGKCDEIPEQFFRLKGSIDEVYAAYNESKENANA